MVNVTEYLKEKDAYNSKIIGRFLGLARVKYFIGGDKSKVTSKRGRHNSHTMFSEDLFDLFVRWMNKEPIPLLNRKEHEVNDFIITCYPDAVRQYQIGKYYFDWYIPSKNLLVEFNEDAHERPHKVAYDKEKNAFLNNHHLFIIKERSVMVDLANMCRLYW